MKEIVGIFTDPHLKSSNTDQVIEAVAQGLDFCVQKGIKNVFCLGDVFDSRVSQKEDVLLAWDFILDMFDERKVMLHVVRGNHDSTSYRSSNSFLKPYKHHPMLNLIDDIGRVKVGDINFYCIAYYDEDIWVERYEELIYEGIEENSYLMAHIAFQGSTNNDGSKVQSSLKPSMFRKFEKVLAGHYHDYQEIPSNIMHLGSLLQNNFGEDERKGFWFLKENGDVELFSLQGVVNFRKIEVNLDDTTPKQAIAIIETFEKANPGCRLRVELTGDKPSIKAFDTSGLKTKGIDVKKNFKEVEFEEEEVGEVRSSTLSEVKAKFEIFCADNEYNYEEGLKILEEAMNECN